MLGVWGFVLPPSLHAVPIDLTPGAFTDAAQPQVAVAPDGRIHVVFGRGNTIYHTSSTDHRTFTPPVEVGALEKLALRMRRGPRVAATDSAVVVTAISHRDGNVHSWISADQGATWKQGPRLNEAENSAREGLHAMIGDGRGFVVAAWLDLRNGGTELWSRTSPDAGTTWGSEVRIYASPDGHICQCCQPSLALGPAGEVAALWRNSIGAARDPWMAASHDRGAHFEPATKAGLGTWTLKACPMDGGALALGPNGQPVSVWRREKSIFLSTAAGSEEKLADGAAQPVIAMAHDERFIVWEEGGGLQLQRGANSPASLASDARAASLAALPRGGVFVVWESTARRTPSLRGELLDP